MVYGFVYALGWGLKAFLELFRCPVCGVGSYCGN